jgi:uncharacterized phage protein gp47/JayE
MPNQYEISQQMVQQLRLLDPSVSAEIGTPERKIIDTVAASINDSQVDLGALQTSLDVDSKYGAALDRFLQLFGFSRQRATYATGFVTFGRTTAATSDIRVPANSTIRAANVLTSGGDPIDVDFFTLFDVILPAGQTSVIAPVRAAVAGTIGNQAANKINQIVGQSLVGVTTVTNETPTAGGSDQESDDEFKVRFKNTVFRNLAGTEDQYLALAVSTAFTTRANVVGPQSHYREYIQVPSVADNASYDINADGTGEAGGGNAGEYTTALSTIPYAKQLWTSLPTFVSNGAAGTASIFYRQDVDFRFNTTATNKNRGDALRIYTAYASSTQPQPNPSSTSVIAPNITFLNIYTGANADVVAVRPGDVVLLEYSYLSDASRNDLANGITNAVDVYIDGANETAATAITTRPTTAAQFVDNPSSKYHYENYRRERDPAKRPVIGNVLVPLFWEPVIDIPSQIIVGTVTYFRGVHYWLVRDTSDLRGTIRARSGIEWSTKVFGKAATDAVSTDPSTYTGTIITDTTGDPAGGMAIEIDDYIYDKNVVDLQSALEGSKQITTDVLAHRATRRYFKFDVTVMYSPGASVAETNAAIQTAVNRFLQSQFFGSAIQLSDILQTIHNVAGVDNVRWTSDIPLPVVGTTPQSLPRVYESNALGQPITGVATERVQPGNATRIEYQELYINGQPTSGTFTLSYGGIASSTLTYNATAAQIQAALNAIPGLGTVTVTENTRSTTNVTYPIRSFGISWATVGARGPISYTPVTPFGGGPFLLNNDFFLRDNELAELPTDVYTPPTGIADTVAGLIIRPRAQGTWTRGL